MLQQYEATHWYFKMVLTSLGNFSDAPISLHYLPLVYQSDPIEQCSEWSSHILRRYIYIHNHKLEVATHRFGLDIMSDNLILASVQRNWSINVSRLFGYINTTD